MLLVMSVSIVLCALQHGRTSRKRTAVLDSDESSGPLADMGEPAAKKAATIVRRWLPLEADVLQRSANVLQLHHGDRAASQQPNIHQLHAQLQLLSEQLAGARSRQHEHEQLLLLLPPLPSSPLTLLQRQYGDCLTQLRRAFVARAFDLAKQQMLCTFWLHWAPEGDAFLCFDEAWAFAQATAHGAFLTASISCEGLLPPGEQLDFKSVACTLTLACMRVMWAMWCVGPRDSSVKLPEAEQHARAAEHEAVNWEPGQPLPAEAAACLNG